MNRPPPKSTLFPYTTLFRSSPAPARTTPSSARRAPTAPAPVACRGSSTPSTAPPRSEEHTSELQSHVNLVCRLLLEKKKILDINKMYRAIYIQTNRNIPHRL